MKRRPVAGSCVSPFAGMTRIRFGGFPLSAVSQPLSRDSPENGETIGRWNGEGKARSVAASYLPPRPSSRLQRSLEPGPSFNGEGFWVPDKPLRGFPG
jgi:hypothetical protein